MSSWPKFRWKDVLQGVLIFLLEELLKKLVGGNPGTHKDADSKGGND